MPVDRNHYDRRRGGGNYSIVIRCPNIVANRLVYFDYNERRRTWVIRDFIARQRLDIRHSRNLTVGDIEADANYSEYPPWRDVRNIDDWSAYLRLRTTAAFRLRRAAIPRNAPNPASGGWRPF